ncbi:PEP-utilizing enzyme [Tateyamaria sp. ANG-S1]|uniref:PEP-utilizing enzyme n=1 Tax=Tateyamaria sp. ANG-S1 TaxID=1577905 RepID=UPI00187C6BD6|nr:PEP-utilizing enzyme [Tateyamaria sp. ANG-S1]
MAQTNKNAIFTSQSSGTWSRSFDDVYTRHLNLDLEGIDADVFWFREDVHHPRPIYPFEAIVPEAIKLGLGQVNTRMLAFPMSNGLDIRVHHGRVYFSPVAPPHAAEADRRAPVFEKRTAHMFERFEDYESNWRLKVNSLIASLNHLPLPRLDDLENEGRALDGGGLSSGHDLCQFLSKLVEGLFQAYQYHFELLNIGYLALLQFSEVFEQAFPSADPATVNTLLRCGDLELYEPQRQIDALARLAERLELVDKVLKAESLEAIAVRGEEDRNTGLWCAELDAARADWFDYSDGIGFSYFDKVWNDHPSIILDRIKDALRRGPKLDKQEPDPAEILSRSLSLIDNSEMRTRFEAAYDRARRVTPYLENHNLYIEHRFQAVFWRRLRALGRVLHDLGWLDSVDDIVLLDRWSLGEMLYEVAADWAAGTKSARPQYWTDRLDRARSAMARYEAARPPERFLGDVPDHISDPILICLFGITDKNVAAARQVSERGGTICGQGASIGVVRGPLYFATCAEDLSHAPEGAIVVCSILPPSWCVSLSGIGGVICEYGGVLSHAAILCREFGKPAVIGVPDAMTRFQPSEMVEIDGKTGRINLLDKKD